MTTEESLIARFVTLLTPLFAALAGWLTGVIAAHIPGVALDSGQITALMVTGATAAIAAALKWLHGWQQHERLVARGEAAPVRGPVVIPGKAA